MAREIKAFALKTTLEVEATQGLRTLGAIERKATAVIHAFKGGLGLISKDAGESMRKVGGFGSAIGGLVGPTTLAVGAIAGLATTVLGAGAALFAVVAKASEFGSKIHDMSQQTGLGAETVSSLKYAADQSSGSLEQLGTGVKKFSVTVAEAARGSEEAKKKLIRLGVDPKEAILDLDKALGKALKSIAQAPPGILRTERAADAFGSKLGASLIPTILSFDGDLEALRARVKKLGGTLTDVEADEMDQFGDALDDIKVAAMGLSNQFAIGVGPEITRTMRDITREAAGNKSSMREWGQGVGDVMRGLRDLADSELGAVVGWLAKMNFELFGGGALVREIRKMGAVARESEVEDVYGPGGKMRGGPASLGGTPENLRMAREAAAREAALSDMEDDARKTGKSAKAATDPLATFKRIAEESGLKLQFFGQESADARVDQEFLRAGIEKTSGALRVQADALKGVALANERAMERLKLAEEGKKKVAEVEAANLQFLTRQREELNQLNGVEKSAIDIADEYIASLEGLKITIEGVNEVTGLGTGELVTMVATLSDAAKAEARYTARLIDNAKWAVKLKRIMEDLNAEMLEFIENAPPIAPPEGSNIVDNDQFERENGPPPPPETIDRWKGAFSQLKDVGEDALRSLAGSLGDLAQQWALTGEAGEGGMQKIVASVLAGVSAQALVLAVMETAYGLAALTPWGAAIYGPAPFHFKAAAMFGAVAALAGLGGRFVAGDSFKQAEPRVAGGPVTRGRPYLVGERRPEVFVPDESGWIHPNAGGGGGGNMWANLVREALAQAAQATSVIERLDSKLRTMRPGDVVAAGAPALPGAMSRNADLTRRLGQELRLP